MINRIWFQIPPDHEFVIRVTRKLGPDNFSVTGVYDPDGPGIDPPWTHDGLTVNGPMNREIDGRATMHFSAAYFGQMPVQIEVTAYVKHKQNNTRFENIDGLKTLTEEFTGKAGDSTDLQYFFFV